MDINYPNAVICALKGIDAVNPRILVQSALSKRIAPGRIHVISIGKAAETMALGALDAWGDDIVDGVVIAPTMEAKLPDTFKAFKGGHPIPNAEGERGARAIIELVNSF